MGEIKEAGIHCPFCGGVFVIRAGAPAEGGGISHPEPERCEKWRSVSSEVFMREAMAAIGAEYVTTGPLS